MKMTTLDGQTIVDLVYLVKSLASVVEALSEACTLMGRELEAGNPRFGQMVREAIAPAELHMKRLKRSAEWGELEG